MTSGFNLTSSHTPRGDQPQAINELSEGLDRGDRFQVLLGVTGSGKTFTMANVIARTGRPALVLAPNKTLAAQLYGELKELFPDNAVEFFVSYYDYYQPEAYIPTSDTFIEKDSSINDEIDKMRHSATRSLLTRSDVIIVASVSCIYGIGSPEAYASLHIFFHQGEEYGRDNLLKKLVEIQYERNDTDFHRGTFRVRGDVVEIFPAYDSEKALRIEFFGDEVEAISEIDPLRGVVLLKLSKCAIYPASHYVSTRETLERAVLQIRDDLDERIRYFRQQNMLLEAQRLEQRTFFDIEMMEEMGFCQGIENYSRYFDGRLTGEPPYTLIDYFPENFVLFVDESHISIPQVGGMYRGDRSRKETLVQYGFRLPAALDNRPLLKSLSSLIEKGRAGQKLAQKEFYPDFNISLEYMQKEAVSTPMTTDPGYDMFSVGVTFNLPFQQERRRAMITESTSETSMAMEELNGLKNNISYTISDTMAQLERRKSLVELYKGGIIPQAEQSLESAVISYRVNKVDFLTLLDGRISLFNYERELYMSQAEYMMGLAKLEAVVGVDVVTVDKSEGQRQ